VRCFDRDADFVAAFFAGLVFGFGGVFRARRKMSSRFFSASESFMTNKLTPKKLADYNIAIHDEDCEFDPALAAKSPLIPYVMRTIMHMSMCDVLSTCLTVRFLKADFDATWAMLEVQNDAARLRSVKAAASVALAGDPDKNLFDKSLAFVNQAHEHRDRFAHRSFGVCAKLPGTLLLLNTKAIAQQFFSRGGQIVRHSPVQSKMALDAQALATVDVYDQPLLNEILRFSTRAEAVMSALLTLLAPNHPERDEARAVLHQILGIRRTTPGPTREPKSETPPASATPDTNGKA
jgi:hypothetical protein